MNDGGHPWLAAVLDLTMRPMYRARGGVVPHARGRVLEIGVGTGLNLDLYGDGVTELVGVDPDPHMLRRARPRAETRPFPVTLHQTGAERLPLDADSFDTALITFTICTIPDPEAALAEVRRVLKPAGTLLFLEHTRATHAAMARVQDAVAPAWRRVFGGCHPNRDAVDLIRAAGFAVDDVTAVGRERWNLLPVYRGVARPSVDRGIARPGGGRDLAGSPAGSVSSPRSPSPPGPGGT